MRKYWFIFVLYWQEGLAQRASFLVERFRSLIVLLSFYYFWTALLSHRSSFAGYDRAQIITYTFGISVLRGVVFATRTEQIAAEINHGRLSAYLLRPVDFKLYTFVRDLSEKSINLVSAIIEIVGLVLIFHMPIRVPDHPVTILLFVLSTIGATLMYFCLGFMAGCWGFWTAEAWGPRFLLELSLEFTAGAFFPLDVLPPTLQHILNLTPAPYLVFFPLNIFLERLTPQTILSGFICQAFWIAAMAMLAQFVWRRGVSLYAAQGG
jgi:ABC-2 type transport system permease protein